MVLSSWYGRCASDAVSSEVAAILAELRSPRSRGIDEPWQAAHVHAVETCTKTQPSGSPLLAGELVSCADCAAKTSSNRPDGWVDDAAGVGDGNAAEAVRVSGAGPIGVIISDPLRVAAGRGWTVR